MIGILSNRRQSPSGNGVEVCDLTCPSCDHVAVLAFEGWDAVACLGCRAELQRPADGLPPLNPGEQLAIRVGVLRDALAADLRAMTEPDGTHSSDYGSRLALFVDILSQAINAYEETQPKPF